MTLILSALSANYVVHVGDRLVTRGSATFDPRSNKSIVYVAKNAIVTIGYSGRAYLDGKPTDEWMADFLAGQELRPDGRGALATGLRLPHRDIGLTMKLLQEELGAAMLRLPQYARAPLQVMATGWQWAERRMTRPVGWKLRNSGSHDRFVLEHHPPSWGWESGRVALLSVPAPSWLTKDELGALMDRGAGAGGVDAVEAELVAAVRSVASRGAPVGRDCVSIYLPLPGSAPVRVRYLPAVPEVAVVAGHRPVPVAFSPWVVGIGAVLAPSMIGGLPDLVNGDLVVSFETLPAVPSSPSDVSFMSSQLRPPEPRR